MSIFKAGRETGTRMAKAYPCSSVVFLNLTEIHLYSFAGVENFRCTKFIKFRLPPTTLHLPLRRHDFLALENNLLYS
ncbi:MAG TPA: hypothetical protein DDW73_08110 [Rhizobium sp.]|nr:hypothetical protein [Rhizobium sp.]